MRRMICLILAFGLTETYSANLRNNTLFWNLISERMEIKYGTSLWNLLVAVIYPNFFNCLYLASDLRDALENGQLQKLLAASCFLRSWDVYLRDLTVFMYTMTVINGIDQRSVLLEMSLAAMDELVKLAQSDEPLWVKSLDEERETSLIMRST
ncbi:unnamed protein product [Eruca vesicaria subsp. sativa]|uniref:START domain-containing protein n=1 Tax=Eruca vesicaria subsp. sativa TaxID=29727 RepID=A0ABC8K0Q0_ERUVS|nr:unnamed protein product [Eruca vesicaria subsp. sativa]